MANQFVTYLSDSENEDNRNTSLNEAEDEDNIEEEIKLISRRTEETLAIVVDHFKDVDERIEEIEYKIEEIESNHEALKKMLIKQLLTENNNRNSS